MEIYLKCKETKLWRKFRDKTVQILVATDVAARGIDVNNISHVINYHLPDESESYLIEVEELQEPVKKEFLSLLFLIEIKIKFLKLKEK